MKITKSQLKRIIKEELESVLSEAQEDVFTKDYDRLYDEAQDGMAALRAAEPLLKKYEIKVNEELKKINSPWDFKIRPKDPKERVETRSGVHILYNFIVNFSKRKE